MEEKKKEKEFGGKKEDEDWCVATIGVVEESMAAATGDGPMMSPTAGLSAPSKLRSLDEMDIFGDKEKEEDWTVATTGVVAAAAAAAAVAVAVAVAVAGAVAVAVAGAVAVVAAVAAAALAAAAAAAVATLQ